MTHKHNSRQWHTHTHTQAQIEEEETNTTIYIYTHNQPTLIYTQLRNSRTHSKIMTQINKYIYIQAHTNADTHKVPPDHAQTLKYLSRERKGQCQTHTGRNKQKEPHFVAQTPINSSSLKTLRANTNTHRYKTTVADRETSRNTYTQREIDTHTLRHT